MAHGHGGHGGGHSESHGGGGGFGFGEFMDALSPEDMAEGAVHIMDEVGMGAQTGMGLFESLTNAMLGPAMGSAEGGSKGGGGHH